MMMHKRFNKPLRGFSLLEVLVALAILAISFTALLLVQGRATNLALEARTLSTATQLARLQLIECKRKAQKIIASAGDFKEEGDFSELGYESFKWECHAPKFNMKAPSASQLDENVKKKAPKDKKDAMQSSASTMSPILSLITDSLGNAVRELVVIIRWGEGEAADEIRVVTHVVDLAPMSMLGKMLKEGANSFGGAKKEEEKPEGQGGAGMPAGGGRPGMGMPPGGGGMMPPGGGGMMPRGGGMMPPGGGMMPRGGGMMPRGGGMMPPGGRGP